MPGYLWEKLESSLRGVARPRPPEGSARPRWTAERHAKFTQPGATGRSLVCWARSWQRVVSRFPSHTTSARWQDPIKQLRGSIEAFIQRITTRAPTVPPARARCEKQPTLKTGVKFIQCRARCRQIVWSDNMTSRRMGLKITQSTFSSGWRRHAI